MYQVYTDGCCKPHKFCKKNQRRYGRCSIGVIIKKDDEVIYEYSNYIGDDFDNNQAEYIAFIHALKKVIDLNLEEVIFYTDSSVISNQMNGNLKVQSELILPFFKEAKELLLKVPNWKVKWIPRKENREADKLATMGMLF